MRCILLHALLLPPLPGDWVVPSEAAICHSASVRRLLTSLSTQTSEESVPDLAPPSKNPACGDDPSCTAAHTQRGLGGVLMGGLWQLVHPDATALHESAALRDCLGVREFSPLQLVGLAGVRGDGSGDGSGDGLLYA